MSLYKRILDAYTSKVEVRVINFTYIECNFKHLSLYIYMCFVLPTLDIYLCTVASVGTKYLNIAAY